MLVELVEEISAISAVMTGGTADNDDFAFSVKLVINDVKTTAIMAAIRTPKTANFCTYIITILLKSTYFLFDTASSSVHYRYLIIENYQKLTNESS